MGEELPAVAAAGQETNRSRSSRSGVVPWAGVPRTLPVIRPGGRAYGPASVTTRRGQPAHTGDMGRRIWAILAAVLAIRAAFTAMGWMSALLETFLVIGLIAAVVVIAVSLVAKRRRPG